MQPDVMKATDMRAKVVTNAVTVEGRQVIRVASYRDIRPCNEQYGCISNQVASMVTPNARLHQAHCNRQPIQRTAMQHTALTSAGLRFRDHRHEECNFQRKCIEFYFYYCSQVIESTFNAT
jgi:hypothetical protein